jgi:hypothetical protein
MSARSEEELLCPSAQPEQPGAVLFGVVGGTATEPRVSYLTRPLPVAQELLELAGPVAPTEVFRFAAACAAEACQHFDGQSCGLATKIAGLVEGSEYGVPPCRIRPRCRWWNQEGAAACRRCPMVVTLAYSPSPEMRRAANPGTPPGEIDQMGSS